MNLFLHNIGDIDSDNFISPTDALIAASPITYDYVLANPPFGKKSSQTFTNDEGEQEHDDLTYNRQDFWATTSNKQLNFVQHIRPCLKQPVWQQLLFPIMSCLKAVPVKPSGRSCWKPLTCIPFFVCQPVFSMPRE